MSLRYSFDFQYYELKFKKPATTSRGSLISKPSFIVTLKDKESLIQARGECPILSGLSVENPSQAEKSLQAIQQYIHQADNLSVPFSMLSYPSVRFGMEMLLLDFNNGGKDIIFNNDFTKGKEGIPINGLIWMDTITEMERQIKRKAAQGFSCIKLKIGALDFASELALIARFRMEYGNAIELRLDANGAFEPDEALEKLEALSRYAIHSIEQPIKACQWVKMQQLCRLSPIPIALDEELIGLKTAVKKREILAFIHPQYIILKPSLIGGFQQADEWIKLAEYLSISWWATSALESNIGLNAIVQWVGGKNNHLPQGLGTGQLFTNNIQMPLELENGYLWRHKYPS